MSDYRLTLREKIYFILMFIAWVIMSSIDYNSMMLFIEP